MAVAKETVTLSLPGRAGKGRRERWGGAPAVSAPRRSARSAHYRLGIFLVLASALALSTLGVGLRQIEAADGWQILFYRSLSFTLTLLIIVAIRSGGRIIAPFRRIGGQGLLVGVFLAGCSMLYVFAMLHTTIANASFVVSTTPFIAAALGWLLLGERVGRATWVAMAAALAGVGLMVADGLGTGGIAGIALALACAFFTAGMLVTVRGAHEIDMIPALTIAGVLTALCSAALASDLEVSAHDMGVAFLLGAGQYAVGYALLTAGARYVPVAEVGLLTLLDTVLNPIWGWLGAGEVPSALTLIGGAIVLGAALSRALAGMRAGG
jgi:drug/metabolite transporter (DMT)-like permease